MKNNFSLSVLIVNRIKGTSFEYLHLLLSSKTHQRPIKSYTSVLYPRHPSRPQFNFNPSPTLQRPPPTLWILIIRQIQPLHHLGLDNHHPEMPARNRVMQIVHLLPGLERRVSRELGLWLAGGRGFE